MTEIQKTAEALRTAMAEEAGARLSRDEAKRAVVKAQMKMVEATAAVAECRQLADHWEGVVGKKQAGVAEHTKRLMAAISAG